MTHAEIIHDRLKKRMNAIVLSQREYAVLKLSRTLDNIALPEGVPPAMQDVLERLMESILETANTSLMATSDALLTAVAEELAAMGRTPS